MKPFVILVGLLLVAVTDISSSHHQYDELHVHFRKEMKEKVEECKAELGITKEEERERHGKHDEDNEKMKCLNACTMRKLGVLEKDNKINIDKFVEITKKIHRDVPDQIKEIIEECVNEARDEENECDFVVRISRCKHRKMRHALRSMPNRHRNIPKEMQETIDECKEELGIKIEEERHGKHDEDNEKRKCLNACTMRKWGVLEKGNKINVDKFVNMTKKIHRNVPDQIKEIIEECVNEAKDVLDECDFATRIVRCKRRKMSQTSRSRQNRSRNVPDELKKSFNECKEELGISAGGNPEKRRCLLACFMKKLGVLTEGNKINLDELIEVSRKFQRHIPDEIEEINEECVEEAKDEKDECDFANKFVKCRRRKMIQASRSNQNHHINISKELQKSIDECKEELGISMEEGQERHVKHDSDNEKRRCLPACFMKKQGILEKDNKINKDKLVVIAEQFHRGVSVYQIRKAVEVCVEQVSTKDEKNECHFGDRISTCIKRQMSRRQEQEDTTMDDCRKELGVLTEEYEELQRTQNFSSKKLRCLPACFMKKHGYMEEGKKLNIVKILEVLKLNNRRIDLDKIKRVYEECAEEGQYTEDDCDFSAFLVKCTNRKLRNNPKAEEAKKNIDECREELGLSAEEHQELVRKHDFDNKKMRCMPACVMKKYNLLEKGKKINMDKMVETSKELFRGDAVQAKETIEECVEKAKDEEDECDFAKSFIRCEQAKVKHGTLPVKPIMKHPLKDISQEMKKTYDVCRSQFGLSIDEEQEMIKNHDFNNEKLHCMPACLLKMSGFMKKDNKLNVENILKNSKEYYALSEENARDMIEKCQKLAQHKEDQCDFAQIFHWCMLNKNVHQSKHSHVVEAAEEE